MSQYPNERGIRHHGQNGTYGESPTSGPAPTTAGHHKHDLLNKLDPRVDSTQDRRPLQTQNNIPAGTYGPHHSRMANALDPRVDSDADHRGHGAAAAPAMHGAAGSAAEGTYGPHRSRVANALDPRVDSDADRRAAYGHVPTGAAAAGAAAPGYGLGPGGAAAAGMGAGAGIGSGPGAGIGHHHQQPVGMAPAAGREMRSGGVYGAGAALPGPAPNTAGPHRSDLMNKLDPRVDSKTGERRDERPYTEGKYAERRA